MGSPNGPHEAHDQPDHACENNESRRNEVIDKESEYAKHSERTVRYHARTRMYLAEVEGAVKVTR